MQKGQTNNPRGRPKIKDALTVALRRELSRTVEVDGKRINGKRILAQRVTELLQTGKATLANGLILQLAPKDWLDLVKWVYQYLEPPVTKNELSGADGAPLEHRIEVIGVDYRTAITNLAPRPMGDSDPSGED